MIKGLDSQLVNSVRERVNKILKETVGTSVPVDIAQIIKKRYLRGFDEKVMEDLEFKQSDKAHRVYAVAMLIVRQEYFNLSGKIFPVRYASVGARYLLMSYDNFSRNVIDHDFNLKSLQEIYTNVSCEAIAYHCVDEFPCAVRNWMNQKFDDMYMTSEWTGNPDFSALKHFENQVITGILEHSMGMNTVHVDEERDRKITGWNIGENKIMLVYL